MTSFRLSKYGGSAVIRYKTASLFIRVPPSADCEPCKVVGQIAFIILKLGRKVLETIKAPSDEKSDLDHTYSTSRVVYVISIKVLREFRSDCDWTLEAVFTQLWFLWLNVSVGQVAI